MTMIDDIGRMIKHNLSSTSLPQLIQFTVRTYRQIHSNLKHGSECHQQVILLTTILLLL